MKIMLSFVNVGFGDPGPLCIPKMSEDQMQMLCAQ